MSYTLLEVVNSAKKLKGGHKMPTQQKNVGKPSKVISFVFRVAGAFVRLTFVRFSKKIPILGSLGKAIETAFELKTKDKKSARSLNTEHPIANTNLAKIQKKAEKAQSQLEALQLKVESAATAEQINTIKTEIDQLIQQVCDCSSQTQLVLLKQQFNKTKDNLTGLCEIVKAQQAEYGAQ